MRLKTTILCSVLMLVSVGCVPSNYDPGKIQENAQKVQSMSEEIKVVSEKITSYAAELAKSNDEKIAKIASEVQKVGSDLTEISDSVSSVSGAVADVKTETDDKFIQTIELIRAGNAASAPINPYAGPIEVGLGLLTAVAGIFAAKKSKDAKVATKKYTAHKIGVEKTMIDADPVIKRAMYENIGEARKSV